MKDRGTFLVALIILLLVALLVVISLDNKTQGSRRDQEINTLTNTVKRLEEKQSSLVPIKGIDGKTPVKGVDYTDGTNGESIQGLKGDKGDKGDTGKSIVGPKGDKGDPAPEIDISCMANKIMKRYTGDLIWQPTNIKCETTDE